MSDSVLCAKPECCHSKARHTGARAVQGLKDRDAGLETACDEFGCSCGGFREEKDDPRAGLDVGGWDLDARSVTLGLVIGAGLTVTFLLLGILAGGAFG